MKCILPGSASSLARPEGRIWASCRFAAVAFAVALASMCSATPAHAALIINSPGANPVTERRSSTSLRLTLDTTANQYFLEFALRTTAAR